MGDADAARDGLGRVLIQEETRMWWQRKRTDEKFYFEGEFVAAARLDNDLELDLDAQQRIGLALERLRAHHMACRKPDRAEARVLDTLRLRILRAVTADPDLEGYYAEAWSLDPPAGDGARHAMMRRPRSHRPVAVMQTELMIRAFFVLQLHLFANAPENEGWMTLFRSWGRSRRFNEVFDELAPTLPAAFRKFYGLYLRDRPSRASASGHLAIHHPWLPVAGARGRGLYMDSGRMEAEAEITVRPGAGGVVDQRGSAGPDQTFETPPPPAGSNEGTPNE
jgi:hypothetical protein